MNRVVLVATAFVATLAWERAFAAPATTADDICPGNPATCNVTAAFQITDNAVLDFGTNTVNVSGSGKFDFGNGSGSILCGNFTASTTNATINAAGPAAAGGTESGAVRLEARRLCTGGPGVCSNNAALSCATNGDCGVSATCNPKTKPACIDGNDCQLGSCGVRRCSLKPGKTCLADANCQLGTCGANKRCSGSVTFVRCASNADCDYGTCPAQLTCANRAVNPVSCGSNTDCDFGTCAIGTASITMGGSITANSDSPGTLVLRAADNVSVSKLINQTSSSLGSDGGDVTIEAAAGAINLTNKITATGGGDSQGGAVELTAGTDVTVGDVVNVIGGDFDGGSVDITAGRDIILNRSLLANSSAGAGFGGDILLDAGRDITMTGVSAANKTTIETNGHTDASNFAGDGGTQDITAGRDMTLNINTRMLGTGSLPDGYGSDMFLDVTGNLVINGDMTAKAEGGQGAGGFLEILTTGTTKVGTTGTFDATGGSGGGGIIEFDTGGNADFAGAADASGATGGSGGSAFFTSDGTTTVSGTLAVNGTGGGSLELQGCRVSLAATGKLTNKVTAGSNKIVARESMKLLAGSSMTSGTSGTNTLEYRTAAKPPVVSGTVTPTATLVVNGALVGCPVCGNLEIDQGETCDDGNTANGDGCSSVCQNEKCVAQTGAPGYPTVPLCDDGNVCTADVCNTTLNGGTCQHPAKNCDDTFACTTDTCNALTGACEHAANDAACADSNPCTDNFCAVGTGCQSTANTNACNDNNSCTTDDICANKVCVGTPIQGCGVCGDGQVNPPEACDDGNATFVSGEYCGVGCVLIPCGHPTNSTTPLPKASDALFVLKAAVSQGLCHPRVCDVDGSGKIVTSDALRILKASVGQPIVLNCPLV